MVISDIPAYNELYSVLDTPVLEAVSRLVCLFMKRLTCSFPDTRSFVLTQFPVNLCNVSRVGRFGSKVGHIGAKWDKSGAFSDQISVHLTWGAKCTEI